MIRMFKCRFCSLVAEWRTDLFSHIKTAHEDKLIEELYYDKKQQDLFEAETQFPEKKDGEK